MGVSCFEPFEVLYQAEVKHFIRQNLADLVHGIMYVVLFVRFMIKLYRETTLQKPSEEQVFTPEKKTAVSEDHLLTSLEFKCKANENVSEKKKDTQTAFSRKFEVKKASDFL